MIKSAQKSSCKIYVIVKNLIFALHFQRILQYEIWWRSVRRGAVCSMGRRTVGGTEKNNEVYNGLSQLCELVSKGRIFKSSRELQLAYTILDRTHSYSFRMHGHLNHRLFQYFIKWIKIPYRSCSRSLHVRVLIANPLISNHEEKCIRLNRNVHKHPST